ncbi:hypothetical protein BDZ97DRAFT_499056 [Flammula alnicola]|nr:hypothetical protein BDZ97DRAFT_499056 [Flammula alnicola]
MALLIQCSHSNALAEKREPSWTLLLCKSNYLSSATDRNMGHILQLIRAQPNPNPNAHAPVVNPIVERFSTIFSTIPLRTGLAWPFQNIFRLHRAAPMKWLPSYSLSVTRTQISLHLPKRKTSYYLLHTRELDPHPSSFMKGHKKRSGGPEPPLYALISLRFWDRLCLMLASPPTRDPTRCSS